MSNIVICFWKSNNSVWW